MGVLVEILSWVGSSLEEMFERLMSGICVPMISSMFLVVPLLLSGISISSWRLEMFMSSCTDGVGEPVHVVALVVVPSGGVACFGGESLSVSIFGAKVVNVTPYPSYDVGVGVKEFKFSSLAARADA